MKLKKAFTLAEAILTMTILGIIAATMITTLKPSAYKSQGFTVLKQKIYNELDGVTQTIAVECSKRMSLGEVYGTGTDCGKTQATHSFNANEVNKYSNYMRGTIGGCAEMASIDGTDASQTYTEAGSLKLKNGACVWFRAAVSGKDTDYNATDVIGKILIDVNGTEGPNATGDGNDRFIVNVGKDGISSDMPKK